MDMLKNAAKTQTQIETELRISTLVGAIQSLISQAGLEGYDIAIDGDAGAGKDTIGTKLSHLLSIAFVNSGDFYRSIAAYYKELSTLPQEERNSIMRDLVESHELNLHAGYFNHKLTLTVNGDDMSEEIQKVSDIVALFSKIQPIRDLVGSAITALSEEQSIAMAGRDIGYIVLPHALFHVILKASPEIRAKRRFDELVIKKAAKDPKVAGLEFTYESVLEDMVERDKIDKETLQRLLASLPEDHPHPTYSVIVDTDQLNQEEVLLEVLTQMYHKLKGSI